MKSIKLKSSLVFLTVYSVSLAIAIFMLSGCSQTYKGEVKSDDPLGRLMKKKEVLLKKGIVSAVAISHSKDLQTGINKVEIETRGQIARLLESKNSSLQKSFREEAGPDFVEHFAQATKNFASTVLSGTTLSENFYEEKKEGYTVYGLMVLDPESLKNALTAQVNANEAMRSRWLASKAYEELKKESEDYEKFKNQDRVKSN